MVGPNCNNLFEEHRFVLLEAFNDCEDFLISCWICLLGLGKFLWPVRDRSSFLTDDRTHLVVTGVGVDFELFSEIGVIQYRVLGDDRLDCFEGLDCFLGPYYRAIFLLSLGERHDRCEVVRSFGPKVAVEVHHSTESTQILILFVYLHNEALHTVFERIYLILYLWNTIKVTLSENNKTLCL